MVSINSQGVLSFDCGLIDDKLRKLNDKLQRGNKDIFSLVEVKQFENELNLRKQEFTVSWIVVDSPCTKKHYFTILD